MNKPTAIIHLGQDDRKYKFQTFNVMGEDGNSEDALFCTTNFIVFVLTKGLNNVAKKKVWFTYEIAHFMDVGKLRWSCLFLWLINW